MGHITAEQLHGFGDRGGLISFWQDEEVSFVALDDLAGLRWWVQCGG